MDIYVWIVVFLIIFMLHNLEEIITIERWFKKIYPRVRKRIPSFAQAEMKKFENISATQFSFVVFLVSVGASALILVTVMTDYYFLFIGLNFLFAINIFTHPLQALYLKCYTPGVWTTILLVIPYYILFFYNFHKAGIFTLNTIVASCVVLIFLIPVFLLSHKWGEKWMSQS